MTEENKQRLFTGFILLLLVGFLASVFISAAEKMSCENGEDVPLGDGSLECWGTETYKQCKPATRFVCHDKED